MWSIVQGREGRRAEGFFQRERNGLEEGHPGTQDPERGSSKRKEIRRNPPHNFMPTTEGVTEDIRWADCSINGNTVATGRGGSREERKFLVLGMLNLRCLWISKRQLNIYGFRAQERVWSWGCRFRRDQQASSGYTMEGLGFPGNVHKAGMSLAVLLRAQGSSPTQGRTGPMAMSALETCRVCASPLGERNEEFCQLT